MSDEWYACSECGVKDEGSTTKWRAKKEQFTYAELEEIKSVCEFNSKGVIEVDDDQFEAITEKIGRDFEADEIQFCNECGAEAKFIMYAHTD